MELDHIDYQILQLLSENARIQWRDLGNQIHMTGQAVGNRIKKLEDNGVIQAYSLVVDELKLGLFLYCLCHYLYETGESSRVYTFCSGAK
jgi:Lrp/AsnC family leucine-responsive transcriptional regulator